MFNARDLITMAGASGMTSAIYFLAKQIRPNLPTALSILMISEAVVWAGGLLTAAITLPGALLLLLNGCVVAATSLGTVLGLLATSVSEGRASK